MPTFSRSKYAIPALLVAIGTFTRIIYWILYPPIYKLHAVFTPLDSSVFAYVANFQGYMAVRMPFYDVLAAAFYTPLNGFLGIQALSAFTVLASIASLPVFYVTVSKLFGAQTATYSLLFYALYPKFIVLAGQGFPEAASVAFLVFALYSFARGLPERQVRWFGTAGLFALLSYLMFIPAVAVGVLLAVWLYVDDIARTESGWKRFIPDPAFVAYSSAPGFVGVLYIVYGPLRESAGVVSGSWSNMSNSLFVHSYGLIERLVRYVVYVYFDFWWHFRGYDKEDGILRIVSSLQDFLGGVFPVYAVGWLAVTLTCAALIIYGLFWLIKKRSAQSVVVTTWILLFILFFTVRNWGWTGVFQTRHVFPIFPAVAIAFGLGASTMVGRLPSGETRAIRPDIPTHTIACILLFVCFVGLLLNGAVEGAIVAENHQLTKERPVAELQSIMSDDESVAVATRWDYYDVVMYSESAIRPQIVAATTQDAGLFSNWTVLADVQHVEPHALSATSADYFYAAHCGKWRPRQKQYLDILNESGAETVHSQTIDRGAGKCTVRTIVVELPQR